MLKSICRVINRLAIFFLFFSPYLQANILISPVKITFEDRQRTSKIYLVNNSEKVQTYRLGWKNNTALETGGYRLLDEDEVQEFNTADSMIRFSPRQVTLKPHDKQTVKLAVRRPSDLADGEYRSHLQLTALPPKKKAAQVEQKGARINMIVSYSLPVIVKQGLGKATVKISDVGLFYDAQNRVSKINISLLKEQPYSVNGDFNVYWAASSGAEEVVVARLHDYTFYHELHSLSQSLAWSDTPPRSGVLRIVYEGRGKNRGKIWSESRINISASSFTPLLAGI